MSLRIFNSLSNQKEEFTPLVEGKVGMYVCGVTVYDMCHVGHARAYVTADVIYRTLRALGLEVTYVRNFTDVDDKIINRANERGSDSRALSDQFIEEFHVDMDALGILRPQQEPRVTDHIDEIIDLVKSLVEGGHAYEIEGDVYFDVPSFKDYGKLSRRNLDDLKAGARVDVDQRKRSPMDFALWKSAKPDEPSWDSPWGKGRPGWHIECSAMSMKYLGQTFDLHGGGKDLVFPHHENEIAQSEAASGKEFARAFFHNGFVNIDKEKMSKSLGNFFTIREMIGRYAPEALRYFLLTTHYRSPINFEVDLACPVCKDEMARTDVEERHCPHCSAELSDAQAAEAIGFPALEEALRRLEYLYTTKQRLDSFLDSGVTGVGEKVRAEEIEGLLPRFWAAMHDDFNAAAGLGVLSDVMRLSNELLDNKDGHPQALLTSSVQALREVLGQMSDVLGILENDAGEALARIQQRAVSSSGVDPSQIDALVDERNAARKNRDFARADEIRDQLMDQGVELMDGPEGTTWKVSG